MNDSKWSRLYEASKSFGVDIIFDKSLANEVAHWKLAASRVLVHNPDHSGCCKDRFSGREIVFNDVDGRDDATMLRVCRVSVLEGAGRAAIDGML